MYLPTLPLILTVSLVPFTTALQNIYLAVRGSSGQQGSYLAFFTDSEPCSDGTYFGRPRIGFQNCNQNLTILGHPEITFTGCEGPGSLPTGVSDGGAPALKCETTQNPVDPALGYAPPFAFCNGGVSLLKICV